MFVIILGAIALVAITANIVLLSLVKDLRKGMDRMYKAYCQKSPTGSMSEIDK